MNAAPPRGPISIFAVSPALRSETVEVVVTLPTFKRPRQVLETLQSLAEQQTGRRFAVIVIENESELREGAATAAPLFERGTMTGIVIVAHERGNCSAYNAGWQTAVERFAKFRHLLVIDDDEVADPHWIERMCSAAEKFKADIVGGPQVPQFPAGAPTAPQSHPVFASPYNTSGPVPALYSSGNLLIGRNVLAAMGPPYLDLRFNFMGGGDSDFLSRSAARGFNLAWCNEAPVFETVPARRLEADWIRSRSLRNGVISTLVERKKREGTPWGRIKTMLKSLALLVASPLRGFVRLIETGSPSTAMYPVYVAIGRLLAEFGYANEQYRHAEKN
jgi:glycosyltransferase involved in cell wall biosynthesis